MIAKATKHERKMTNRGFRYLKRKYWNCFRHALPKDQRPELDESQAKALANIQNDGITVQAASEVLSAHGQEALRDVREVIMAEIASPEVQSTIAGGINVDNQKKPYLIQLISGPVESNGPLAKLALDESVLQVVSQYLGYQPIWHNVSAWVNLPTGGEAMESQLWHRDPEDYHVVKVFFYINDVDEDTGPFNYVIGSHSRSKAGFKVPIYKDNVRVTDEGMETVYPRSQWKICVGPADTLIIADTVGFHKGGKPEKHNRILVTMTYTSGAPLVDRHLRISDKPTWDMTPLQKGALALNFVGKARKAENAYG